MMPTVRTTDSEDVAALVDVALETGQTLIFPTDTVYGLGGNPWDQRTLDHVRRLKSRDAHQPFTLHLWDTSAIPRYAHCSPEMERLVHRLLPGPFTLLLPASASAPASTVQNGVVGIRVPDHPFFTSVLRRPLFGTSVNRSGEDPINDATEIIETFSEVDLIVTGPVSGISSAILDLSVRPYRLLRGSLTEEVRRLLDEE
jgi:L-threonylcarbamoyladenylate synthase